MASETKTKLTDLIARLENLTGPDREVDAAICLRFGYIGPHQKGAVENLRLGEGDSGDNDDPDWLDYEMMDLYGEVTCTDQTPPLTASLDAAVALVERVLPEWQRMIAHNWGCVHGREPESRKFIVELRPALLEDGEPNVEDTFDIRTYGPTEPIALCLATLRALSEEERG